MVPAFRGVAPETDMVQVMTAARGPNGKAMTVFSSSSTATSTLSRWSTFAATSRTPSPACLTQNCLHTPTCIMRATLCHSNEAASVSMQALCGHVGPVGPTRPSCVTSMYAKVRRTRISDQYYQSSTKQ